MVLGRLPFSAEKSVMKWSTSSGMSSLRCAQRRHLDRDDVQPVEEVLAEAARRDRSGRFWLEAASTRTSTRSGLLAADPLEGLLLQRAQHLGLGLEAHVADLVEEERAAVGELELAAAPRHAPVKAPRSWPKSSDSISSSGMAAQLTSTNGPVAPRGQGVDGARHQLLAGAVLAVDQHAAVGRRGDGDLLAQLLDQRGSSPTISLRRARAARADRGSRARAARGRGRASRPAASSRARAASR